MVVGEKPVYRSPGKVEHAIKASFDGNAKLGQREEVLGNGDGEGFHNVFASHTTVGGAHAYGSEFVIIIGVFVKGHKVVGCIEVGDFFVDSVVENEFKEGGIEVKVRVLI